MKIKDLFKQMEKANEFAKMVGENEWHLEVAFDDFWYGAESFSSYKDFIKWFKKEYIEEFREVALETNIDLTTNGQGKGNFVTQYWWLHDRKEEHTICVNFYRR